MAGVAPGPVVLRITAYAPQMIPLSASFGSLTLQLLS